MQATSALPAGYNERGGASLENNRRPLILLNLAGIPWAALCAVFFLFMASVYGSLPNSGSATLTATTLVVALVALALVVVATLVLHELTHGLFFWLFTRARPRFGFKGLYAYAAAPGWYVPRGPFLLIDLAPLILLSALLLLIALFVNATGAIGDLYMVARLVAAPCDALIEDQGEGIRWFSPAA